MNNPNILNRVVVVYPSGNTTAIVFDRLPSCDMEYLNSQINLAWKTLDISKTEIEQCCYVKQAINENAVSRIEMFGMEFCGNATRGVVQIITGGKDNQGMIEVSGVDRPLNFNVSNGVITVEMPIPQNENIATQITEGTLVQLDGIAQLVVTETTIRQRRTPRELLNNLLKENSYGLADQSAVGITYYDRDTKSANFCVWVKKVNTVFDETSCGSGTCAIGVASALEARQSQKIEVVQPSGECISTEAVYEHESGKVVASNIAGKVSVLYDGELILS